MTRPLCSTPTAPSRGFTAPTGRSAGAPRLGTQPLAGSARLGRSLSPPTGRSYRVRLIAVGTALAGGPPHRSQRALLTHWALALGQTWSRASGKGCSTRAGGSHRV